MISLLFKILFTQKNLLAANSQFLHVRFWRVRMYNKCQETRLNDVIEIFVRQKALKCPKNEHFYGTFISS